MPILSVLLPCYEAVATLEEAVASLRAQTFEDWELVLVEDGSQDGSLELARRLAGEESRIRLVEQSHVGIVKALIRGLEVAQGQFIARMDADDVCHRQRFERQLEHLAQNQGVGLVSCRVEHVGTESSQQGYAEYVRWINGLVSAEAIFLQRFVESPFAHPSVVFRRELLDRHGGYRDGDFPEDYDLWLRWLAAGVRMAKVPEVLLQWRDLPGRLSRADGRYRLEAFYRLKFQYLAQVLPKDRSLWVWGAGRATRQRAAWLEAMGVCIEGYFEVDPCKVGELRPGLRVRLFEEIPPPGEIFILVLAGARGVREKVSIFLRGINWSEGRDYLLGA